MLLKELCQRNGVSGNEKQVREYILEQIIEKVNHIRIDKIGNLVAEKTSSLPNLPNPPKVLLCAHMDEVGLMITEITTDGYLRFQPVGGLDPQILVSKTIQIGEKNIQGVIGSKAIHLQKKEERKKILRIDELYIDIGANSKEEAESEVKLGDYAVFTSTFETLGKAEFYKAKALDDRVGCALLVEVLEQRYPCDLITAFTVQEEVGLRGSKVISNYVQADLAVILEATRAADFDESDQANWIVELGKGPACSLMDCGTIYQPELIHKVVDLAKKNEIPLQFRQSTSAANDAGNIHQAGKGIPTITLSVPCRNIHSMSSVIAKNDYENCQNLLRAILENVHMFCSEKQVEEVHHV